MYTRTPEEKVTMEWERRLEKIKHKVRICNKMIALEQDIYSRSFWCDYKQTLMHRFNTLVKTHDYIAN